MVRSWQLLVGSLLLVGVAVAENEIFGLSSNPPETPGFSIHQGLRQVTISLSGSYIFWAEDDEDPDGLGQIKKIWVFSGDEEHPEVAGTVVVGVYQWWTQENGPAARDVWEIDLSNATDGQVGLVRIAGNYGDAVEGGPLQTDYAYTLDIGGSVLKAISVDELDRLTLGGTLAMDLICNGPLGDIRHPGRRPAPWHYLCERRLRGNAACPWGLCQHWGGWGRGRCHSM